MEICPGCGGSLITLDEVTGHIICDTCEAEWLYGELINIENNKKAVRKEGEKSDYEVI